VDQFAYTVEDLRARLREEWVVEVALAFLARTDSGEQ
jgi:hypothetical protein